MSGAAGVQAFGTPATSAMFFALVLGTLSVLLAWRWCEKTQALGLDEVGQQPAQATAPSLHASGLRQIARESLPVWRDCLDTTRQTAERTIGDLSHSFHAIGRRLEACVVAVDQATGSTQGRKDASRFDKGIESCVRILRKVVSTLAASLVDKTHVAGTLRSLVARMNAMSLLSAEVSSLAALRRVPSHTSAMQPCAVPPPDCRHPPYG